MFSVSEASVAVITGGSSGIGLNAARALRDRGLNVYELSRRAENAEPGVTHLQADVTDETQVNAAVAEILRREGRIDILINNAGFGISGAIEFTPPQEARRQFDVNFFGMVNMNRAVLPVMQSRGIYLVAQDGAPSAEKDVASLTYALEGDALQAEQNYAIAEYYVRRIHPAKS